MNGKSVESLFYTIMLVMVPTISAAISADSLAESSYIDIFKRQASEGQSGLTTCPLSGAREECLSVEIVNPDRSSNGYIHVCPSDGKHLQYL